MTSQSEDDSCLSSDDAVTKAIRLKNGQKQQGRILRDKPPVPFSPRHQELNRMRDRVLRGVPKPVESDSTRASESEGGDPEDAQSSDAENTAFKRRIEHQSQQAYTKMRRLEAASNNICDMAKRTRRTNASGIIKSIKLYNFMCHKTFYQEWHENLNFVVGENGSGKSALLSGLIIGLGGRALSTARTNSVKELIKTGETHAQTEVVLLNRGKLPVEEYGEQITVRRIIDQKGHSTYKLQFGSKSKFKPATKIELDNILRLLDIQLENPVVILNQEYARSFLRTKDPKDKYKLFEDGVGTAQCDAMRNQVSETLADIGGCMESKKEELKKLERDYKEAKEKVKLIDSVGSYQEKLDALDRELKWHYVQLEEHKETQAKEEVKKKADAVERAESQYNESLENQRKAEAETQPNSEEQNERKRRKNELQQRREELVREIRQLMNEKVRAEMKLKTAETGIPKSTHTIQKLEQKLKTMEEKAENDREVQMRRYLEEKDRLAEQIEQLKEEISALEADKRQFSEGLKTIKAQIEETESQRESITNQIRMKERQLHKMESSSSSVAAFGAQMESLVEKVNANKRKFSQPPRGPLGACITVKDPKYIDIIQYVLRNNLHDFVVHNQQDFKLLDTLINQCYSGGRGGGRRPTIHIIPFKSRAYDVSERNCSKGITHPSLLDMLDFDNNDHVVMNTLLEINSIERILLFKNNEEGLGLLSSRETAPRNCRVGYSMDFYKITPDPNLRCDAIQQRSNSMKLLKTSHTQQKRTLQIEIETLKDELNNFVVSQESREEQQRLSSRIRTVEEECRNKRMQRSQFTQDLQNLKEPPNRVADLASLREELETKKEEKERMEKEVVEHRQAVSERKAAVDEKDAEKRNVDAEIEKITKEMMRAMESLQKKKEDIEKLALFAEKFKRKRDQAAQEVQLAERKLAGTSERVRQLRDEALLLGDRIEVTRGSAEIKKEHDQTKAQIEHLQRYADRHQNIRERYADLRKRYKKYNRDYNLVMEMYRKVMKYFGKVNTHYLYARDQVCEALKNCYVAVAASRKYHGKIEIDHNSRELFYLICPDKESLEKIEQHSREDGKYKNKMVEYAAGLSGGERSFSTICFIIAMWQAMKTPFYMLDEFDVFMDAQNRKVSQEALMTHAREFPNNQFFFFTPLDLTRIPSSDEALILRLYPPERNATEEVLPNIEPESVPAVAGPSRKRGRADKEAPGPSKARRV